MNLYNEEEWGFFIDLELDTFDTYPEQENITQHENRVNYKTVINIRKNKSYDEYDFDYPPQPITTTTTVYNRKKYPMYNIINLFMICIIIYSFDLYRFMFN
jgi:hypothetical protein